MIDVSGIKDPSVRSVLIALASQLQGQEDLLNAARVKQMLAKPYGRDLERIIGAIVFKLFLQDTNASPDVLGGFQRVADRLKWLNSVEVKTLAHLDDLISGAALTAPIWFPQETPVPTYVFPTARLVSGTNKEGYGFPKATAAGMMGEIQIPEVSLTATGAKRPLRLYFEYGAAGVGTDKTACFSMKYRIAAPGQNIATVDQIWILKIEFPVVAGVAESVLKSVYTEIPGGAEVQLSDNCLIVIDQFWRDTISIVDDYSGEVMLMGTKTAWRVA